MEITNPSNNPAPRPVKPWVHRIYLGSVLIAIGAVLALYNFKLLKYWEFNLIFSWPVLLMVIGGYLLAIRKWAAGSLALLIGALFVTADVLCIDIPFDKVAIPALCIFAGLALMLTRKQR
jgi:hypothetical protein